MTTWKILIFAFIFTEFLHKSRIISENVISLQMAMCVYCLILAFLAKKNITFRYKLKESRKIWHLLFHIIWKNINKSWTTFTHTFYQAIFLCFCSINFLKYSESLIIGTSITVILAIPGLIKFPFPQLPWFFYYYILAIPEFLECHYK